MSETRVASAAPDASLAALFARLNHWDRRQFGLIPMQAVEEMMAHPGFVSAVLLLMRKMLDLNTHDPLQDSIRKDLGRYFCAALAVYLDVTGGLTLPRLKQVCAESGLLSPGRARAFLLYLRLIGYAQPAPEKSFGRAGRYVPTEKMTRAFEDQLRIGLEALALIEPGVAQLLPHVEEPAVFGAMMKQLGLGAIDAARLRDVEPATSWEVFAPRTGGTQVLYCLFEAALMQDGGASPIEISVSHLSQRSGISRAQVLRLLRDAERGGLLRRSEDTQIELSALFKRDAAAILATNLISRAILALRGFEALQADTRS